MGIREANHQGTTEIYHISKSKYTRIFQLLWDLASLLIFSTPLFALTNLSQCKLKSEVRPDVLEDQVAE